MSKLSYPQESLQRDIESLRSLNFSENYIKITTENTTKWGSTGLLGGIDDPFIARSVATLMENQRIFNEQWEAQDANDAAQWRRVSIPVIRRTFGPQFLGYHLASVQIMKSPQENTYHTGFDGRTIAGMTEAGTRRLGTKWEGPEWKYNENGEATHIEWKGQKYHTGLDAEAEATATFCESLCNEFSREIIRDLAANAGSSAVYDFKDEKHLHSLIEGMSAYISAKTKGKEATWIVTSPQIVKLLSGFIEPATNQFGEVVSVDDQRHGINWVGQVSKQWKLFEDSTAPAGNILMGHKDSRNHYFSGYVFAPFLPCLLGEGGRKEGEMFGRYGKKLLNPGFFGTIKIENLPEVTPLEPEPEAEPESEE